MHWMSIVRSVEHPYVTLARDAIRHHLATGRLIAVEPDDTPAQGVFVSLHEPARPEAEGRLRGCVGSVVPTEPTLRAELVRQAVNAATSDPRFPPVRDVDDLDITVYLLQRPVPVEGPEDLDPSRYGVIVENRAGRRALLLPAIPGIETAEQQIAIARRKAYIGADEPVRLYRFEAEILT